MTEDPENGADMGDRPDDPVIDPEEPEDEE